MAIDAFGSFYLPNREIRCLILHWYPTSINWCNGFLIFANVAANIIQNEFIRNKLT